MVRGPGRRDLGPMSETPSSPTPDPRDAPTTEAPTTPQEPAPRHLVRPREDRVIAGVCAGIARYFRIDPLIVRIAAVALLFAGGFSLIAYLAAWALVPEDDGTGAPARDKPSRTATIVGAVLVVLAGIALLDGIGPTPLHFGWAFGSLAPIAVIALLLALAGQRLLRSRGEPRPAASRVIGAALVLCGVLLGSLILAVASGWATASGGGTVVAAIVIALGIAMVALSFRTPRARWLALPAMVLAIPAGVVSAAGIDAEGGVGERTYRPPSVADIRPDGYRLGTGELEVDLRTMEWPGRAPVDLKVKVGIGHALVVVPEDVCVTAKAHAGMGYVNVLGEDSGGADVDQDSGSLSRWSGKALVLDADVGLGAVEVRHSRDHHDGPGFRDRPDDAITSDLADAGCAGNRA
jgi:phage shock protein PspC (stress-responsive transcriptional regulator)